MYLHIMITLITFSEPLVDAEHPPMNISMKNIIRQVEGQLISVIVNPDVVITLIHCTALNLIDSENEKSEINVSVSVQSTIAEIIIFAKVLSSRSFINNFQLPRMR